MNYLKIDGEKTSTDYDAAERYINEFAKIIFEGNLSPEQICNADARALYWPSTLPLSHLLPCNVLSKKKVKIYTKNIPFRNPKSVWSQGLRIKDYEPVQGFVEFEGILVCKVPEYPSSNDLHIKTIPM